MNGIANLDGMKDRLVQQVGEVIAEKIVASGRSAVAQKILESEISS
jgi:transcription initiation factor TFIID subunit 6